MLSPNLVFSVGNLPHDLVCPAFGGLHQIDGVQTHDSWSTVAGYPIILCLVLRWRIKDQPM